MVVLEVEIFGKVLVQVVQETLQVHHQVKEIMVVMVLVLVQILEVEVEVELVLLEIMDLVSRRCMVVMVQLLQ
jgi:hypothetical protein